MRPLAIDDSMIIRVGPVDLLPVRFGARRSVRDFSAAHSAASSPSRYSEGIMSWNDERIEKLRELWDAGHTAREIADVLGSTRNAVLGVRFRYGLANRDQSEATIKSNQARAGETRGGWKWTVQAVERLREMWSNGDSLHYIAMELGVSQDAVRKARARYGMDARSGTAGARTANMARFAGNARLGLRTSAPRRVYVPPPNAPTSLCVSIVDVAPNQCRFIAGEPTSGCCGHPIADGERSWCLYHASIVYNPVARERSDVRAAVAYHAA